MTDLRTLDPHGMKWMGAVPDNWSISPAKRHFCIQLGKMLQNGPEAENDCTVPYLKAVNVLWGRVNTEDAPEMWASPDEIMLYGVRDGDLLVCEGGEVGRAGIVRNPPDRCVIQNALHRVRARNSSSVSFLMYVLHSVNSSGWFDVLCNKATIAHFTGEKFAELRVPLPSPKRQRAIATFLDRETSRIDELIAKKQRQIDLLQEKRSALISHVVTKGLDPDVKMKDSGVEWLGKIPEHWKVKKLKHIVQDNLVNGIFKKKDSFGSGVKLINVYDIYRDDFFVHSASLERVEAEVSEQKKYAVFAGDIFFVRSSLKLEGVGRSVCALDIDEPTVFECHVVRTRPKRELVNPEYLIHYLNSAPTINRLISLSNNVTMATIGQDKIKNLEIVLPPRTEQDLMMASLEQDLAFMYDFRNRILTSIEKLREYRTALISAAVTGKIDVREEVA